jgi:hypothetical protein
MNGITLMMTKSMVLYVGRAGVAHLDAAELERDARDPTSVGAPFELSLSGRTQKKCSGTGRTWSGTLSVINTDDVLTNLPWGLIRDWRRRRDVDPAIRREWKGPKGSRGN